MTSIYRGWYREGSKGGLSGDTKKSPNVILNIHNPQGLNEPEDQNRAVTEQDHDLESEKVLERDETDRRLQNTGRSQ